MEYQPYEKRYKEQCLVVFDSNLGKYFDSSEREEFIEYLDSLGVSNDYCVYLSQGRVLACGGVNKQSNVATLTWGMVQREFHGKGLGTKLTAFRLSNLKADRDIAKVIIETSQHTEGFYRKQGFLTTNIIKNGFGEGIDCVSMELRTYP
ncbi:GNAT family N-acetyltransferase [Vibrio kasasachensis]|uniref:GNAT family N-acetyltransferase n=1 Tax=Vibrio kasasachensis TaxID=2910248 RepID=UPI003D150CC4